MRKALIAALTALALVASAAPAGFAHGTHQGPRKVAKKYTRAHGVRGGALTVGVFGTISGEWISFKTRRGEDHAKLKVIDDLGGPVSASVYYKGELLDDFCGSSDDIRFDGGRRLIVTIWAGQCADDTTASAVSQGRVKATFTDRL